MRLSGPSGRNSHLLACMENIFAMERVARGSLRRQEVVDEGLVGKANSSRGISTLYRGFQNEAGTKLGVKGFLTS
jgi:hypothetical protein